MTSNTPIPIIIINWKGIKDTLECVESVLKMNFQNFKVYLVENGSDDGSADILMKKYGNHPKIDVCLNADNLGFTKANNLIFRRILEADHKPEYIALLNNDTSVDKGWLGNLVIGAEKRGSAVTSSKMIDYYDRSLMDNAGHLMLNTGEVIPIGHARSVKDYCKGFKNMGACAGAGLYATRMLEDIGVFDEHFTTGYEDAELGIRAVVSGYQCWYEPTAIVYHKMGQSIKKIFNYNYSLMIQKNIWYSYIKLMPGILILMTIPSFLVKYLALFFLNIIYRRTKFMKIIFISIKEALWQELDIALQARRNFSPKKRVGFLKISRRQHFFLWMDMIRFYKYFILNKHTSIDVYGKIEKV